MTATTQDNELSFSRDFTPVISDHSLDVFAGKIRQVHATTDDRGGHGQRSGTFTVEVVEVFAGRVAKPGGLITLAFYQDIHPEFMKRGGLNPWNGVTVSEGHAVLLACKSTDGGRTWQPVAALNADPPHAADVDAVRQAYRIEVARDDDKPVLIGQALQSPNPVLLSYALNALSERDVVGHAQAVNLMSFALISTSVPAANREEVGRGLAELFDKKGLSDAERTNILAALARVMVDAKEKPQQAEWAALLRSCLMAKDAGPDARRYALVKGITVPRAEQVIEVLTALEHDMAEEADPEERALLGRMAHIWQIAKR